MTKDDLAMMCGDLLESQIAFDESYNKWKAENSEQHREECEMNSAKITKALNAIINNVWNALHPDTTIMN